MGSPQRRLLSVIIPVCNGADAITAQLEALKAQQYDGDWEIIVVNNRSTDATVSVVQDYQRHMPHLHLVHAPKMQARAYAINVGAQAAKGEVFLFCDGDDIVAPGWVAALAEALETHHVVAGALDVWPPSSQPASEPSNLRIFSASPHLEFLPFAIGSNSAVSRQAFEAIGGFSEDLFRNADVDFSWRLQLRGYTIHTVPTAVVYSRRWESLRIIWQKNVVTGKAEVYLYQKFAVYGMPRPSTREILGKYKRLLKKAPHLWNAKVSLRRTWVGQAGNCWGRLQGSLRYRALYL